MPKCRWISRLVLGVLCATVVAQNPPTPVPPVPGPRAGAPPRNRTRREPCWQVAGIPRGAMRQARTVRLQAREEIEAVCANSSLTLKQKHEQIRGIHQREKQQVEALISPQQEQALRACRQERGLGRQEGGGGRGMGPCGELPRGKKTEAEPDPED